MIYLIQPLIVLVLVIVYNVKIRRMQADWKMLHKLSYWQSDNIKRLCAQLEDAQAGIITPIKIDTCQHCGQDNPSEARHCRFCGTLLCGRSMIPGKPSKRDASCQFRRENLSYGDDDFTQDQAEVNREVGRILAGAERQKRQRSVLMFMEDGSCQSVPVGDHCP